MRVALALVAGALGLSTPACLGLGRALQASVDRHYGRLDLSGDGWRLWLDRDAAWEQDVLVAPPVDVGRLPVRPPTGGWDALARSSIDVAVPGTVEQHFWERLGGDGIGPDEAGRSTDGSPPGDYRGVSWWWRTFELRPQDVLPGPEGLPRRAVLHFEAVRLRAEVFVNEAFVGYDAVGNTPFEVDVTGSVRVGRNVLAVRVTDPGGNFDWRDDTAQRWGEQTIPASHGFGGVTGPVWLRLLPAVHVDDVCVRNTPAVTDVTVLVTVRNTLSRAVYRDVLVDVEGDGAVGRKPRGRCETTLRNRLLAPGDTVIECPLSCPDAEPWTPETPSLYVCAVTLAAPGSVEPQAEAGATRLARFGFRWFAPDVPDAPAGTDVSDAGSAGAVFRLNGRRIVLRSAISWGFWPITGLVPGPDLARRQVEAARSLGLNMLNHHRCIAAPGLLDVQDELGLLAYEEPGGYASHGGDALCETLAREKLLRMIRRDRNHPSLVIVNMINEETAPPGDRARRDLADAHALDPTRTITFTSAWAGEGRDPLKLHVRPDDDTLHTEGWRDDHNAAGPGVWRDEFWQGPDEHLRATNDPGDRDEIVFWGEEGAIAAPPRLQLIRESLQRREAAGKGLGWDGAAYEARARALAAYLDEQGFRGAFPTLDALTSSLGDVALDYQRRAIETVRLGDVTDGYVINGWEDSKLENHSGIVDCWRNPKGDAALLARANAPLALVVSLRSSVVALAEPPPIRVVADVGLINEADLRGPGRLDVTLRDAAGRELWARGFDVQVAGGETYGQGLIRDVIVEAAAPPGRCVLSAELRAAGAGVGAGARGAEVVARGEDELLVVDGSVGDLPSNGAVLESSHAIRRVLKAWGVAAPQTFSEELPKLDFVLVGDFDPDLEEVIPKGQFFVEGLLGDSHVFGERDGLDAFYFQDETLQQPALQMIQPNIDFDWTRGDPAPGMSRTHYSVRFVGKLRSPETGTYRLHVLADDGVRLWVDGALLIDDWEDHAARVNHAPPLPWHSGEVHDLRLEYRQAEDTAIVRLMWTPPGRTARVERTLADLLRRAREDGTTVAFLDHADGWAPRLAAAGALSFDGVLEHGNYWLGGGFFVREHPLFDGLPTGCALGRPYQDLVHYGARRFGLLLRGEEAVVGCLTGHDPRVATAVGIVPAGKGRILLSTLDIVGALKDVTRPGDVPRRLLRNAIAWAGAPR